MSKFPEKALEGDDAHTQITCYHRKFVKNRCVMASFSYASSSYFNVLQLLNNQMSFARNRWVNSPPSHFKQCGLEILHHVTQVPLPVYRKPWNEDCLIGWAAIGERIRNEVEKQWYKERLAEAAENAKNGWYVDWELVVCVGRKAVLERG